MRILIASLGLAASVFCAPAVLQTRSMSDANMSEAEVEWYERLKKSPGVVRTKLVTLNEGVLSRESRVVLPLFDGRQGDYRVAKAGRESRWIGRGDNLDRFSIRKTGKSFSGQILYQGRQYVLVPVKSGVSILYEQSNALIGCGNSDSQGEK